MPDVTIEPWMRAAAFKLEHDAISFSQETIENIIATAYAAREQDGELLAACKAAYPFFAEDFPDENPDAECCVTNQYREAFRKLKSALAGDSR